MTQRYCRVCTGWHDLAEAWPEECLGHFGSRQQTSIQIIKDIEPYKAIATDCATGKRPNIGSRSTHREFLKRNGYVEMGNEPVKQRPWDYGKEITPKDVRQTYEQLRSEKR